MVIFIKIALHVTRNMEADINAPAAFQLGFPAKQVFQLLAILFQFFYRVRKGFYLCDFFACLIVFFRGFIGVQADGHIYFAVLHRIVYHNRGV